PPQLGACGSQTVSELESGSPRLEQTQLWAGPGNAIGPLRSHWPQVGEPVSRSQFEIVPAVREELSAVCESCPIPVQPVSSSLPGRPMKATLAGISLGRTHGPAH